MASTAEYLVAQCQRLIQYLHHLQANPDVSPDEQLLEDARFRFLERAPRGEVIRLVNAIAATIPDFRFDPRPLAELAERLVIDSGYFEWKDIVEIDPPINFLQGLEAPLPSLNYLTLSLLRKSSASFQGVSYVASKPDLVMALVRLWLTTSDTSAAVRAQAVLTSLLRFRPSAQLPIEPVNLMWKRILDDRDVYELFFACCSRRGSPQREERALSIAQDRLLDFLREMRDGPQFLRSYFPDIEARYGVKQGGLIHFALFHMIDPADILLARSLKQFYAGYIARDRIDDEVTPNLQLLIDSGIHRQQVQQFLGENDMGFDDSVLVEYIGAWGLYFPLHFMRMPADWATALFHKVQKLLRSVPYARLQDLNMEPLVFRLLRNLPRAFCIEANELNSLVDFVPLEPMNPYVLDLLARLFRGYDPVCRAGVAVPLTEETSLTHMPHFFADAERGSARALYYLYSSSHRDFFSRVVACALNEEGKFTTNTTLAALHLLSSFFTSEWSLLPESSTAFQVAHGFKLADEGHLRRRLGPSFRLDRDHVEMMCDPHVMMALGNFLQRVHPITPADAANEARFRVGAAIRKAVAQAAQDEGLGADLHTVESVQKILNGMLANGAGHANTSAANGRPPDVATMNR